MSSEDALAFACGTAWERQGEWGGTTLWRSMTYCGLQSRVAPWTGVDVGYEGFLHAGRTTYIGASQYPRFAQAYLARLRAEDEPLAAFCARFDGWLDEAHALERDLHGWIEARDAVARFLRLHAEMQPYSYVFGYGEDQVVGALLRERIAEAGAGPEALARAATAPPSDAEATRAIDAAPSSLRPLLLRIRRQAMVRTQRRELWSRVEALMRPRLVAVGGPRVDEWTHEELALVVAGERAPSHRALDARAGAAFVAWRARPWLLPSAPIEAGLRLPRDAPRRELSGTVGNPGRVVGRVRIVLTPAEGDRLRPGEVLVSDMTTPDVVLACSRAAAIVTDRGGMLCHAAIVSREFGIPCVLGTEHATASLRDGDLVEVDAERGVVRLLDSPGA